MKLLKIGKILSLSALILISSNTIALSLNPPAEQILLAELVGWDAKINVESLTRSNGEPAAIVVQMLVGKKPVTTKANIVYQLSVQKDNNWVQVYQSKGERLISNSSENIQLEPEIIPMSQLREVLGQNIDFNALQINVSAQITYDLTSGETGKELYLSSLGKFTSLTNNITSQNSNTEVPPKVINQTPASPQNTTTQIITNKSQFSLAIRQPAGENNTIIARLSLKAKRGNSYLRERYIGDFSYQTNTRANFSQGLLIDDRIVVRLYDGENNIIGYSEFELAAPSMAVNLIIPEISSRSGLVRTVYGIDANKDGKIDENRRLADYFTQLTTGQNNQEQVTFLSRSANINLNLYQSPELPPVSLFYPPALSSGPFSLMNRTITFYNTGIAPALKVEPQKNYPLIAVADNNSYNVSQYMSNHRQKGVSEGIAINFSDVADNHWAKNFISELAAQEIIQGFPDGNFRPNEGVTKAEFAAMISRAFNFSQRRQGIFFKDIPANHWAAKIIRDVYEMGFFEGETFNPDKKISKLDAVVILAQGLPYSLKNSPDNILKIYSDKQTIPANYRDAVAGVTEQGMLNNLPNKNVFNGSQLLTRAEVAALLYQAILTTR